MEEEKQEYIFSPAPVLLSAADCESMKRWALHRCNRCGNGVLIPVTAIPAGAIIRVGKERIEDAMRKCRIPPLIIAYDIIGSRQQVCPMCGGEIQYYPERIVTPAEKTKIDRAEKAAADKKERKSEAVSE